MPTHTDELLPLVRATLSDDPDNCAHQEFTDDQLRASLALVIVTGEGPAGFTISADRMTITPEVVAAADWAVLVAATALSRVSGGMAGAMSWKTRPMSITDRGQRKRDLLNTLLNVLYRARLGAAGLPFAGGRSHFISWLQSIRTTPLLENATVEEQEGIQVPSV